VSSRTRAQKCAKGPQPHNEYHAYDALNARFHTEWNNTENLKKVFPHRRRDFEYTAMLRSLVKRTGFWLPTPANAEAMAPPAPTLFLCAARGKDIVLTLTEELEGRFGGNRFDELPEGDEYAPETHHYPNVVIVLTDGISEERKASLLALDRALDRRANEADPPNIVLVWSRDRGWAFEAPLSREAQRFYGLKTRLTDREGMPYYTTEEDPNELSRSEWLSAFMRRFVERLQPASVRSLTGPALPPAHPPPPLPHCPRAHALVL
jgi:hypothetical protein